MFNRKRLPTFTRDDIEVAIMYLASRDEEDVPDNDRILSVYHKAKSVVTITDTGATTRVKLGEFYISL